MFIDIFSHLDALEGFLWSYLAIPFIVIIGVYLSWKSRFSQVRKFPQVVSHFFSEAKTTDHQDGIHPLKAFFASIGGCIGIANIVAVCTAIQIGGPGAIFWMWVTALIGMIVKYSEVYLGISFRVPNKNGGYDGGPMQYLQKIFSTKTVPVIFAIFLAIYGTEVYMFDVMCHSISENWHINHWVCAGIIFILVLYASRGGIERIGKISSILIPGFIVIFSGMSLWILGSHFTELPSFFKLIFKSAFKGHAPLGGFAGSSIMLAISQGAARSCYSGDIGVGYAGIVHAESATKKPHKQAQLSILGVFLDTFVICTFSTLIVLVTGVWHLDIAPSLMVQKALEMYFPYVWFFMPLFIFLLGFSTLMAFFCIGIKCAKFISPKKGEKLYYIYSSSMFLIFSFVDQKYALSLMSIAGACLLSINLYAMTRLRKHIRFF